MKWITPATSKWTEWPAPGSFGARGPASGVPFVPEGQLLDTARKEEAIPFDATRFAEVKLNHRGRALYV